MSTQAWGFRAILGCRSKAPRPPKGRKVGCDAGGHPSPWPLIFSSCRRVKCVPQHHCLPPWCQAHSFHQWAGSGKPTYSEKWLSSSWWCYLFPASCEADPEGIPELEGQTRTETDVFCMRKLTCGSWPERREVNSAGREQTEMGTTPPPRQRELRNREREAWSLRRPRWRWGCSPCAGDGVGWGRVGR